MAAAETAYARLFQALRQLRADIEAVPSASLRLKSYVAKRQSAAHALQRHAQATLAEIAFVEGDRIEQADPHLLAVFYADPMHAVAARYCWALLAADEGQPSLQQIIAATQAEFDVFHAKQHEPAPVQRAGSELGALGAAESAYAKRTDRLAYRLAVLRRLMIIQRHVGGPSAPASSLETEIAQTIEVTEEATESLREIRKTKISKRRRPDDD